jgi:hypothetical protein
MRAAILACVVLLTLPTAVAGALHGPVPMTAADDPQPSLSTAATPDLTVVTTQGGSVGGGADSRVLLFDPETGEALWQHDGYATYYDVDPVGGSKLLYVGMLDDGTTYAVVHDWRTGTHRRLFRIPFDSHDIDSLGDGEYVYLDGRNDTVVVYNDSLGETVWTYDFREHFPTDAGNGPPTDYSGDYTHLNDVVPVDGGSKFLVSPRNFDRVMLVDRESKAVEWTLGREDDYDVLNQQHNPSLVASDPPTVLVADSENDRVVEYRREGGEWRLVWEYRGDLVWPRDADRLPNGNTLIVDSYRAVEVTPDREVVRETETPRYLYDVERVGLGDEPGGPSMVEYREAFGSPRDERSRAIGGPIADAEDAYADVYNTVYWVLPWWLGPLAFGSLLPAVLLLFAWLNLELERAMSGRSRDAILRLRRGVARYRARSTAGLPSRYRPFVPGLTLLAAGVLVLPLGVVSRMAVVGGPVDAGGWWNWIPPHVSVSLLLSMDGLRRLLTAGGRKSGPFARLHATVAVVTVCTGVTFATLGTLSAIDPSGRANAGLLRSFGVVAVFGVLSLVRTPAAPHPDRWLRRSAAVPRTSAPASVRYVAGVGVVGVSVAALGEGLRTPMFPLLYLALAFVLLLNGDEIMSRAVATADWRSSVHGVLLVFRYAVRPVWVGVGAALVAKISGAGAMASVVADVHFLNPITFGVVLFVCSRVVGTLSDLPGAGVAVRSD